jgi:hypothetical protein
MRTSIPMVRPATRKELSAVQRCRPDRSEVGHLRDPEGASDRVGETSGARPAAAARDAAARDRTVRASPPHGRVGVVRLPEQLGQALALRIAERRHAPPRQQPLRSVQSQNDALADGTVADLVAADLGDSPADLAQAEVLVECLRRSASRASVGSTRAMAWAFVKASLPVRTASSKGPGKDRIGTRLTRNDIGVKRPSRSNSSAAPTAARRRSGRRWSGRAPAGRGRGAAPDTSAIESRASAPAAPGRLRSPRRRSGPRVGGSR